MSALLPPAMQQVVRYRPPSWLPGRPQPGACELAASHWAPRQHTHREHRSPVTRQPDSKVTEPAQPAGQAADPSFAERSRARGQVVEEMLAEFEHVRPWYFCAELPLEEIVTGFPRWVDGRRADSGEPIESFLQITDDYTACMERGEVFPPVLCWEEVSGGYGIGNGRHRVLAAWRLGRRTFPAFVWVSWEGMSFPAVLAWNAALNDGWKHQAGPVWDVLAAAHDGRNRPRRGVAALIEDVGAQRSSPGRCVSAT